MSTSFNFPTNPTLNQVVVLPDGNSAQWNGYAWVSVGDNVTYPLAVPKGGTGATNPFTAKRNLDIPIWTLDDTMPAAPVYGDRWIRPGSMTEVVWLPNVGGTGVWVNLADVGSVAYPIPISKGGTGATDAAGARTALGITPVNIGALPIDGTGTMIAPLKLADGTVATPALVWNSEPGLGFFREGASQISIAVQGMRVAYLAANLANSTALYINPRAANSTASLSLFNQPAASAPNYNATSLVTTQAGYTQLVNSATGSVAVMPVLIQGDGVILTPTNPAQAQNELRLEANNVANAQNSIFGKVTGTTYWRMDLGDTTAATGTSTGKDFRILRFNNSSTLIDIPLVIQRATGDVYIANTGSNLVLPGGRIAFPGTHSPSALPNVLDDYRELDTFGLVNGAGVPITIVSAKLVKVGKVVTMWLQCSFGASSSQGSVILTLTGVPSIYSGFGSLSVGYPGSGGSAGYYVQINGFDINLYYGNGFATFAQMSGLQFYIGGSYVASN